MYIFLKKSVFSRGQLYVAMSRVTSHEGVKIVYKEVIQYLRTTGLLLFL